MYNKLARSKFNINPLLLKRWSPKSFDDRSVETITLKKIIDAARWAPSSFNEQPWRFIIGKKEGTTYDKILKTLGNSNKEWAQKAPVLMITCGKITFTHNDKINEHFAYDVGQAMANLSIQATEEDLYLHQMAGFSSEKAIEYFNIPNNYQPLTATAIGYIGRVDYWGNSLQNNESEKRIRKNMDEICYTENWNTPFGD